MTSISGEIGDGDDGDVAHGWVGDRGEELHVRSMQKAAALQPQ